MVGALFCSRGHHQLVLVLSWSPTIRLGNPAVLHSRPLTPPQLDDTDSRPAIQLAASLANRHQFLREQSVRGVHRWYVAQTAGATGTASALSPVSASAFPILLDVVVAGSASR